MKPERKNKSAGSLAVSTTTPLVAFTSMGNSARVVGGSFENADASETLEVTIETSEFGTYADTEAVVLTIPPQKEGSFEVGPGQSRCFFRASARTLSGNAVTVKYRLWTVE